MATIVKLPAPLPRRPVQADTQSGATILFFTGVRYERYEEPEEDPCALETKFAPVSAAVEPNACMAL